MESDLIKLYSTRILALVANIPHLGNLDAPAARVRERSPQCGSVVTVALDVEDGRIARFAQDVKACALGQAAAAVVGGAVLGRTLPEIRQARSELRRMLDGGESPKAPFEGLEVLRAAVPFANRHASILLSITATEKAMEEAEAAACA